METLYKFPLLDPRSDEGFRIVSQSADTCADGNTPHGWSVKSRILRGGLKEGVQVVEINNGKLSFAVLPSRGMGIWKGTCGDTRLGWNSPVNDPVHPAFIQLQECGGLGWLKGFNEWIVRCGLGSMGAPGPDAVPDSNGNTSEVFLTLHGNIANTPARAVSVEITGETIILKGEVDETRMFGPSLRLNTEIRTEFGSGTLTIIDTVTNIGHNPAEHEMLYHINYGEPLLEKGSRMAAPFKQVAPRDPRAAEGIQTFDQFGAPEAGFAEQVYLYELIGKRGTRETMTLLRNDAGNRASLLRFSLKDFPCFALWKNTAAKADGYVTGLEPGTNYPNPRQFEREKGRLIRLAGGESRRTKLVIENLDTKKAIQAAEAEIRHLQKTAKAHVHPQPFPSFSGS
jgi:hypothetical protein